MKIIHILQSSYFSGAENVVCQIIKMFKSDLQYSMTYVSRGGEIESILKQMDIPFYKLENFDLKSIHKAINILKPDIIHVHDISASVLVSIASLGKPCKIISHVHVNNSDMSKINIKTLCYALSTIKYKHIFWVSQSCFDGFVLKKLVNRKSTVLPNVIDKSLIIKKANSDNKEYNYDVAYVGRLTEQKDPARLILVLDKLISKYQNIKIVIVGKGNLEEATKKLVIKHGLEKNIKFTGFMENPLKLLKDSKVMIMTSKYEGLPMTVLEAMALGVPIVSTPVDGLKDVVIQGVNGYLENSDEMLVKRLYDIICDSNLQQKLSLGAKHRFDELNNVKEYKLNLKKFYREK